MHAIVSFGEGEFAPEGIHGIMFVFVFLDGSKGLESGDKSGKCMTIKVRFISFLQTLG